MKTNLLKYLKLALVAVLMVNLTSCEIEIDSFYDDDNIGNGYYNRSVDLTSRTWVSFYRDVEGNYCCQELDFYLDRTGVDYIRVEYPDGYVETFEYRFRWSWENYAQTSIRMDYGPGDVSFLDDVYIGGNRLSGYLDGRNNFVEYQGKR
ncbi:hypothetical protein [Bacteroides sp.]|uniref:hypothetical protein n=1 Tax=Bacteroides sp. TaxID=29523 RepID=UPI00262A8C78|nr:hypothetical protein [Bacteroides sp.]MDD3038904.1 hypothetical protein [Bacteroides sp.]